MLITIDGPEKVGKTTLARALQRMYGAQIRKWGPISEHYEYAGPLKDDIERSARGRLVVWDRAWASEHVYAVLMKRDGHIMGKDPWAGEWMHGRACDAVGLKVIMLGPTDIAPVVAARDETDLPVDPAKERELFAAHGKRFGYLVVQDERTTPVEELAQHLYEMASMAWVTRLSNPPGYCGPSDARVVVLTDKIDIPTEEHGEWLPFSSPYGENLARVLGDWALKVGWGVAGMVNPAELRKRHVVACGEWPALWTKYNVGQANVTNVPHVRRMSAHERSATAAKIISILRSRENEQARSGYVRWPLVGQQTAR